MRLAEELLVLRGYERGGSAESAFGALSFYKRQLYVASYLSALWNELASLRLRLHGPRCAIAGDDLLAAEKEEETGRGSQRGAQQGGQQRGQGGGGDGTDDVAAGDRDAAAAVDGHAAFDTMIEHTSADTPQVNPLEPAPAAHQRVVTSACGGEPVARVGLQMPSSGVQYGLPELQQCFEARLAADGVPQSALPNRRHWRALIVIPARVGLEWLDAATPSSSRDDQRTDEDHAAGEEAPTTGDSDVNYAARIRFVLPPSSYATMAMRQLLGCSSAALQSPTSDS